MQRRIPSAALAAALLLALPGCAAVGDARERDLDARGPITFAMGANDTGKLLPVVEAWNAARPEEPVTLHELPQESDGQRETLVQSLQAHSGDYDVMALDVTWTAEFAANGWLQPLAGPMSLDTSGLLPATVESATYRDTLYAAPQNTNAQLLFYRTDIVPEAPGSWQELLAHCPQAEAAGLDCLLLQLKNYEGLTVQATQAVGAWGGRIVAEDGLTPAADSPDAAAGLEALVAAYRDGHVPARANGFTEEETNLAFLAGESVFAYNWPYMYDTARNEPTSTIGDSFAVAPIVGPDGTGASTLGGYNNGINVYGEHKATARDFIAFVQNEENQRAFAEQSFPPVLASVYDDPGLVAAHPYLPALKTALEHASPRPGSPFYATVSKAIRDNVAAALSGERSVEQALRDIDAAVATAAR